MWFKCEHMSTDDMFLCVHVVSPTDVNDSSDRSQLCKLSSLTVPRSLIKNRRSAANWASSAAPRPRRPPSRQGLLGLAGPAAARLRVPEPADRRRLNSSPASLENPTLVYCWLSRPRVGLQLGAAVQSHRTTLNQVKSSSRFSSVIMSHSFTCCR